LAQGYRIFSIAGSTPTLIGTVGAGVNIFGVTGATAGSNVSYMVQAFDGPTTANSNTVSSVPSFAIADFTNGNGTTVHMASTGTSNVIFIDGKGHMALGNYLSPTTASSPDYPNDIATFNGNTVVWSDGTIWTMTPNPATQVTLAQYANPKGVPVNVIENGTNTLAFVDGAGNTSLGTFLNPTQAVAQLYPGDVASFNVNSVNWLDGTVWTKKNSTPSVLPVSNGGGNLNVNNINYHSSVIFVGDTGQTQAANGVQSSNKIYWSSRPIADGFDSIP
jgi:hypothetical protein